MTILSVNDCKKYILHLRSSLDESWLDAGLKKISDYYKTDKNTIKLGPFEQFHPLLRNLDATFRQISRSDSENESHATTDMIISAMLGKSITVLKEKKCVGLDKKIADLMLPNFDQFPKTTYEIQVGAILADLNHQVQFVEESTSGEKTPDILLESQIEVECKKKDVKSKLEKQNEIFFGQIPKKIAKLINDKNKGFLIIVKTKKNPTQEIINNSVTKIHELIINDVEGNFFVTDAEIQIKKILDDNEIIDLGTLVHPTDFDMLGVIKNLLKQKTGNNDIFDWIIKKSHHYVFDPKISIRNSDNRGSLSALGVFVFESMELPERLANVINSIKKGKRQLSGKTPGIIFVDLEYNPESIVSDFHQITPLVHSILNNNSRITVVVITFEVHLNENGIIHFYHDGKVFLNPSPKHSLPSDFKIFETVESPAYTLRKTDPNTRTVEPTDSHAVTFSYICISCKNKHDIQANLFVGLPIQSGFQKFPVSNNLFTCPNCGNIKDLSDVRETIEQQTKKKIVE